MAENGCGYARVGISIGKSQGNAVVRNRLKRLLREVFRQSQVLIPADFDYLIMVSQAWRKKYQFSDLKFELLRESFLNLVNELVKKVR